MPDNYFHILIVLEKSISNRGWGYIVGCGWERNSSSGRYTNVYSELSGGWGAWPERCCCVWTSHPVEIQQTMLAMVEIIWNILLHI